MTTPTSRPVTAHEARLADKTFGPAYRAGYEGRDYPIPLAEGDGFRAAWKGAYWDGRRRRADNEAYQARITAERNAAWKANMEAASGIVRAEDLRLDATNAWGEPLERDTGDFGDRVAINEYRLAVQADAGGGESANPPPVPDGAVYLETCLNTGKPLDECGCLEEGPDGDDGGLSTMEKAIVRNKSAWGPIDENDPRPDNRAAELAAARNLADKVSAAFENESREDRERRRRIEPDAGKYGRVYYRTNLLAEVRVLDRWKVLYDGSTLFPAKRDRNFPSVASRLLDDMRMRRVTDVRLVPLDFKTPDDDKAEQTASDYEAENFLNIAAE